MLAQGGRFLFGLFIGLLVAGLLVLLLAEPRGLAIELVPAPTAGPRRGPGPGAVRNPGIVDVLPGAIVADAIAAAGGALPGADLDALNLAASVGPGERVFVPLPGTAAPTAGGIPARSTPRPDTTRA